MNIKHKRTAISKLRMGLTALTLLLAGCGGGGSSPSAGTGTGTDTVTGVATPSKVSVVNTN